MNNKYEHEDNFTGILEEMGERNVAPEGLYVIVYSGNDFFLIPFKGEYNQFIDQLGKINETRIVQWAVNREEGKRILKMYKEGYGRE
jgi:hypothetical protein